MISKTLSTIIAKFRILKNNILDKQTRANFPHSTTIIMNKKI